MKVKVWLIKTKDGQIYRLTQADKPGWALAHYVVAEHYNIPLDEVVDTGWTFEEGEEVWRRDIIKGRRI